MKNMLTVMRFEYKGFVGAKSFRVVSIIFVVVLLVLTSIPQLMGVFQKAGIGEDSGVASKDKAALILSGEAVTNEIYIDAFSPEALAEVTSVEWVRLSENETDEAGLNKSIQDGEYIFALRYAGGTSFDFFAPGNRMASYSTIGVMADYITESVKKAETALLPLDTQEAVERISSLQAKANVIDIGGNAQNNFWIGYVLIMFMFYIIMGYTQYVSSSIITEKTSKAMELLVTAVKPIHLMVGKVLGVGFAALTQVGIIVGAAAAGILINLPYWKSTNSDIFEIIQGGNIDSSIIWIVLGYFLLGFFVYAFLCAALASTVTRPEEAATVTIFPLVLMMAALGIGFLTLSGAASKTLIAVLSYIPFFTPTGMLARYTIGDASSVHLIIGAVILAAAIVVVAIIAAKIFRVGVMLYGVKATPKQLFKALKNA